ncbi:hypothetical protein T484DRAFT_1757398, partial [Baffinella frigidus]
MAPRLHSRRRRPWYVQPVETVGGENGNTVSNRHEDKVFCGYLFNAAAERTASGYVVGDGEECCISMEPIADACLPFSHTLCVSASSPTLTGVQLLCGHRFSAVYLLWHWCMSPMICPMCRAEYCRTRNGAHTEDVRKCKVENFPVSSWRLLRRLIRTHVQEQEDEERSQLLLLQSETVVEDVMDTVLGDDQMFMLMMSIGNGDSSTDFVEYLQLHRTNSNYDALDVNQFNFNVQRASLRRFTASMNRAAQADSAAGIGMCQGSRVIRPTVVMRMSNRVGDEDSFFMQIAQVAEIKLPVFHMGQRVPEPPQQTASVASSRQTVDVGAFRRTVAVDIDSSTTGPVTPTERPVAVHTIPSVGSVPTPPVDSVPTPPVDSVPTPPVDSVPTPP